MSNSNTISNNELENHLKKTTIRTQLLSFVTTLITGVILINTFYVNTNKTLDEHSVELIEIKKEATSVKETLNNAKVTQGISNAEISAMKETMSHIQQQQDKMDDKLDKIMMQTK